VFKSLPCFITKLEEVAPHPPFKGMVMAEVLKGAVTNFNIQRKVGWVGGVMMPFLHHIINNYFTKGQKSREKRRVDLLFVWW